MKVNYKAMPTHLKNVFYVVLSSFSLDNIQEIYDLALNGMYDLKDTSDLATKLCYASVGYLVPKVIDAFEESKLEEVNERNQSTGLLESKAVMEELK